MKTSLRLALLLIGCGSSLLLISLRLGAQEDQVSALASSKAPTNEASYFLDEEEIAAVLALSRTDHKDASVLSMKQTIFDDAVRRLETIKDFKRYHEQNGNLTTEGCYLLWPRHSDMKYADHDKLSLLENMVLRADNALIARVLASGSGLGPTGFLTQFDFEVLETLGASEAGVEAGQRFFSTTVDFDLLVDGERFCMIREGFRTLKAGDEYLLLGFKTNSVGGFFGVTNHFPIIGERVELQSYGWLEDNSETRLQELRRIRADTLIVGPGR